MAAPSPDFIVAQPPPLNSRVWPLIVDGLPADEVFGELGGFTPLPDPPKLEAPTL